MTDTADYAHCVDCPEVFADRKASEAHQAATLTATGEAGFTHRSHSVQIDNPTPEEKAINNARRIVARAVEVRLDAAFEDLYYEMRQGRITKEQVKEELRSYPDFVDAWGEWYDNSTDDDEVPADA